MNQGREGRTITFCANQILALTVMMVTRFNYFELLKKFLFLTLTCLQ